MGAQLICVALGGAIGASLRHLSGVWLFRLLGPGFPYGTLFVNVVGSLAMGVLIASLLKFDISSTNWRLFLVTGLLGGFTTFSAFSLDAITLWERGELFAAFSYVITSVVVSILALWAGLMFVRALS